ncbi:MAG TPA: hypothetical protein VIH93_12315 [Thermoanaerobaculia bacterium]
MKTRFTPWILLVWLSATGAAVAQTFSVSGHFSDFTAGDCKNLVFYADEAVATFGFNQVTWKLLRNGQVIDQTVQNFYGFFSIPVSVTFTRPPQSGTYTMAESSYFNSQSYPLISVTLTKASTNICPLGSYDGANCFYRTKPATGFIFNNMFYVAAQRSHTCVKGSFDGANCYLMPKPGNGFIYHNSFYVSKTGSSCPATVNGFPTSFDSANCYIYSAPWGTTAFEYHGAWYTQSLPSCPLGFFDGANCYIVQAPPPTQAFEYLGGWYTSAKWCG